MIEVWVCSTANGVKPIILLEEMGLPYRCHGVNLMAGEHRAADLLAINPLGKVPMLRDPDGPDGHPIVMGESGAMANYLVAKTGLLGGTNLRETTEIDYWCQATNATISAMMARKFWVTFLAPEKVPAIIEAVEAECIRYLEAFENHLSNERTFLVGDRFTIADALFWPHTYYSSKFLSGGLTQLPSLQRYCDLLAARPSIARAVDVVKAASAF
jgi:GSH-dependent disulfide-bond oxidoreductase